MNKMTLAVLRYTAEDTFRTLERYVRAYVRRDGLVVSASGHVLQHLNLNSGQQINSITGPIQNLPFTTFVEGHQENSTYTGS